MKSRKPVLQDSSPRTPRLTLQLRLWPGSLSTQWSLNWQLADCCLGNSTEISLTGISLLCARGCKFVPDALFCWFSKLAHWKTLAVRLQPVSLHPLQWHPPLPFDSVFLLGFLQPAPCSCPQAVDTVWSHFIPGCCAVRNAVTLWAKMAAVGSCGSLATARCDENSAKRGQLYVGYFGTELRATRLSACLSQCGSAKWGGHR